MKSCDLPLILSLVWNNNHLSEISHRFFHLGYFYLNNWLFKTNHLTISFILTWKKWIKKNCTMCHSIDWRIWNIGSSIFITLIHVNVELYFCPILLSTIATLSGNFLLTYAKNNLYFLISFCWNQSINEISELVKVLF